MVDYNNETTVTRPAADVARIQILERRANIIEAFEFYQKNEASRIQLGVGVLQSRIYGLFLEIQAALKRRKPEKYKELFLQVKSRKYDDLLQAFLFMNEYLDEIQLTTIDTKTNLGGNIIERNKAHGVPI